MLWTLTKIGNFQIPEESRIDISNIWNPNTKVREHEAVVALWKTQIL